MLIRNPGDEHPWHTDIESSAPDARFISVWVGIQNSSRVSTLKLISNSHLFGKSLQGVASQRGFRRGEASDDVVLDWAREFDSPGYAPHQYGHDVAIVVLDGTVETMGRVVEPYGVVFYAAGEGL